MRSQQRILVACDEYLKSFGGFPSIVTNFAISKKNKERGFTLEVEDHDETADLTKININLRISYRQVAHLRLLFENNLVSQIDDDEQKDFKEIWEEMNTQMQAGLEKEINKEVGIFFYVFL